MNETAIKADFFMFQRIVIDFTTCFKGLLTCLWIDRARRGRREPVGTAHLPGSLFSFLINCFQKAFSKMLCDIHLIPFAVSLKQP